jgi:hypothetical protein
MGLGSIGLRAAYLGTYFLGRFRLRICQETLLDMGCISSLADLNLVISTLSWGFLALLKNSYHPPISLPILPRIRVITAVLQIIHFMALSKSIVVNSYSVNRFALLFSIPYCLFFSCAFQRRSYDLTILLALATFCTVQYSSQLTPSRYLSKGLALD